MWWAEKWLKQLGGHKNVSKIAWRAKFNLMKTQNRASLTLELQTISNPIPALLFMFIPILWYRSLNTV